MVAPSDPKGINKLGAPRAIDYPIESWGYVHGRFQRSRQYFGLAFFVGGAILIILTAFLLHRLGTDNAHQSSAKLHRAGQMSEPALADYIRRHEIRTVIRLVGDGGGNQPGYRADVAATEAAGAEFFMTSLPTSRLPRRDEMLRLFEALDRVAADPALQPVLVH